MRTLSSASLDLLASGQELEPITLIAVTWVLGGNEIWYSDKATINGTLGRILEVSPFQENQRSDSSGLAGALSVKLDDRDGALKSILDQHDVHLRIVKVYQWFWGLDDSEKFLIFAGQISTPLVWDEGTRTVSFDIVTKIEDQEVGWSAEMGAYQNVAQDLVGVGWPMIFGTVVHSPCLQLQNIPTAFTTAGFGLPDMTLGIQLVNLQNLLAEAVLATEYFSLLAADSDPTDPLDFQGRAQNDSTVQQYVQMQADIQTQIDVIKQTQGWQASAGSGPVGLIPTVFINKPFNGRVRVGNNIFEAEMNRFKGSLQTNRVIIPGSSAGPDLRSGFQYFPAGSQVAIADNYPIDYVVSIVPGTLIDVWALRSWNGTQQMSKIPASYYTVRTETDGPFTTTIVSLTMPLSTRAFLDNLKTQNWENNFGQSLPPHIVNQVDWEDKLYATFESSVGPNPVDIMIWFITYYTNNTYDSTSFTAVSTLLAGFPMNFTYSQRTNVLDVLAEIAYQARCIIYLRDDIFYLLYLPKEQDAVDTITEDSIVVGSLQITTTPTEELVTRYIATYRPDYSPFYEKPVTAIFRFNIAKYGVHDDSHDFYCYNNFYSVEKAASFWMIRKSQTWKIIRAKLLLTKLNLEVFDTVTLSFATPYLATGDVKGFITSCQYNSSDKTIDVEIWTPVLLGAMTANKFAWPSNLTEIDIWPPYHDIGSGAGAQFSAGYSGQGGQSPRLTLGVIDGFQFIEDNSSVGPELRFAWTSGDPTPGDASFSRYSIPAVSADIATPFTPTPSTDPTEDYSYSTPPDPKIPTFKEMVPGRVDKYVGPDPNNGNVSNYKVDVYDKGLLNKPTSRVVGQLQIDPDDRIPNGTWTFVNTNQIKDDKGNQVSERSMQIPVWLQ